MYCLISCKEKNLYIKLSEKGTPITCSKREAKVFDNTKARNVLKTFPKNLKRMNFQIEPVIPEEKSEDEFLINVTDMKEKVAIKSKEIIKSSSYQVPTNVMTWTNRVAQCNELFSDAKERKDELYECLSNVDKNLSNILHKIELQNNMNACMGYMQYKAIKECLKKRRVIKDEIYILDVILTKTDGKYHIPSSQKMMWSIDHLENREFRIRDVEDIKWLDELCEE